MLLTLHLFPDKHQAAYPLFEDYKYNWHCYLNAFS